MENTAREVKKALIALNKVKEALDKIVNSSQTVKDAVVHIAAATEEQSIASEEISKNVESMAKLTEEVEKLVEKVEEAVYESVEISSDLRHTAASVKAEKLKESFFDLFKSDHERMILRIKAHLRGIEQLNPELLGDYRACGIGKWYYEGEGQKFTSHPAFKEFEEIHKQCHLIAKEVILAYNAGDSEKEQKLMKELEDLISRLNSALDKVKNIYLSETERN